MTHLILGGARSGKSRYALDCAADYRSQTDSSAATCYFIATATAGDKEMTARIERHKSERPSHWQTIEAATDLVTALDNISGLGAVVVIDCLTLWLSNILAIAPLDDVDNASTFDSYSVNQSVGEKVNEFVAAIQRFDGQLIIVSNEVGSGIVPMGELSRQFVDLAGFIHQAIAKVAQQVTLVVAGYPVPVKRKGVC